MVLKERNAGGYSSRQEAAITYFFVAHRVALNADCNYFRVPKCLLTATKVAENLASSFIFRKIFSKIIPNVSLCKRCIKRVSRTHAPRDLLDSRNTNVRSAFEKARRSLKRNDKCGTVLSIKKRKNKYEQLLLSIQRGRATSLFHAPYVLEVPPKWLNYVILRKPCARGFVSS